MIEEDIEIKSQKKVESSHLKVNDQSHKKY